MRLEDFQYELAVERIAQSPIEPRDSSRLLVDRGARPPEHRHVRDLVDLLEPGDLLVVNETKVIPARLRLRRRSGGAVEVLLLEPLDGARLRWEAMIRPARRVRAGEVLVSAGGDPVVTVEGRSDTGDTFEVELAGARTPGTDPLALIEAHGEMPLPPYVTERLADGGRYQTVYAREPGSAAAPTAGLHFTPDLLGRLTAAGIAIAPVELMVGLDTFRPIAVDDVTEHRMHSERYRVPSTTVAACHETRARGGRVVAIGTTAVRALESAAATGVLEGRTDLFIRRGFDWRVVDVLMTNFHLPRSTLLVMIDAFVGPRWKRLYDEALREEYRFLSFGDAMLLVRGVDP